MLTSLKVLKKHFMSTFCSLFLLSVLDIFEAYFQTLLLQMPFLWIFHERFLSLIQRSSTIEL